MAGLKFLKTVQLCPIDKVHVHSSFVRSNIVRLIEKVHFNKFLKTVQFAPFEEKCEIRQRFGSCLNLIKKKLNWINSSKRLIWAELYENEDSPNCWKISNLVMISSNSWKRSDSIPLFYKVEIDKFLKTVKFGQIDVVKRNVKLLKKFQFFAIDKDDLLNLLERVKYHCWLEKWNFAKLLKTVQFRAIDQITLISSNSTKLCNSF